MDTKKYNTVKVYDSIQDVTGEGEEQVVNKKGDVIHVFFDGNWKRIKPDPDFNKDEITKIPA